MGTRRNPQLDAAVNATMNLINQTASEIIAEFFIESLRRSIEAQNGSAPQIEAGLKNLHREMVEHLALDKIKCPNCKGLLLDPETNEPCLTCARTGEVNGARWVDFCFRRSLGHIVSRMDAHGIGHYLADTCAGIRDIARKRQGGAN